MNHFLVILVMLVLSAFFSAMEIAYLASNKLRIELDRQQGLFASRFIAIFTKNPNRYITTMLVGNNIALVVYGIFMAIILEPLFLKITSSPLTILILQTLVSTIIILFTAEFIPKALVRIDPNKALNVFSLPVMFFYLLLYPVSQSVIWLSHGILRSIFKTNVTEQFNKRVFGKVDLDFLISQSHTDTQEQENTQSEIKLFQNALDFSNVKLRDCLVPRTEIVAMDINSPVEDLKQKFIETGFSKILIYKENIDQIVGYITSKELFKNPKTLGSKIIEVSFVPETMPANKLLKKFIQEKKNLAVVVDEFGGIAGMLTIEDIIEEIFGEIEDEHDTSELIEKQVNEDEYIFSGRLEIDYINERYFLDIPVSEEYETLAGFIFNHHESLPKMNERIMINNFEIKVLKVTKTKIETVLLKVNK